MLSDIQLASGGENQNQYTNMQERARQHSTDDNLIGKFIIKSVWSWSCIQNHIDRKLQWPTKNKWEFKNMGTICDSSKV